MTFGSDECDPNEFYSEQTKEHDDASFTQAVANYCTTSFVLCFAPFIIVTPFCVKKLNVLTRKIIAMIVLADTLKLITDLILDQRKRQYEVPRGYTLFECTLVSVIGSSAPIWSMLWAFFLILGVWLSLQDQLKILLSKTAMFLFFSSVVWPLGFLVTWIPNFHASSKKLDFTENYVSSKSCQSNFTFALANNGTKCLIEEEGAIVWSSYYCIICVLIAAINTVFIMVFIQTYINYRKTKQLVDPREQYKKAVGFIVAANNQKNVVISSIQYSLIGFIYGVTYLPVAVNKVYAIFNGPDAEADGFFVALIIYSTIMTNFTAIMNILFYGFFSRVFMAEMIRIFRQLVGRCRNKQKKVKERLSLIRRSVKPVQQRLSDTSVSTYYISDSE